MLINIISSLKVYSIAEYYYKGCNLHVQQSPAKNSHALMIFKPRGKLETDRVTRTKINMIIVFMLRSRCLNQAHCTMLVPALTTEHPAAGVFDNEVSKDRLTYIKDKIYVHYVPKQKKAAYVHVHIKIHVILYDKFKHATACINQI